MAKNIICTTCRGSGWRVCATCDDEQHILRCSDCEGTGVDDSDDAECICCDGHGYFSSDKETPGAEKCPECKAKRPTCYDCDGRGVVLNPNHPKPTQVSP